MSDLNKALISKLSWNLASNNSNSETLWIKILSAKYLGTPNFFTTDTTASTSSWIWKGIMKAKNRI